MDQASSMEQILSEYRAATDAARQVLPTEDAFIPPENGITLFDTKNEIFLAYLQALALRNLHVLRTSLKSGSDEDAESTKQRSDAITRKLVEHRVYLERGIRPLEQKLKFQVDRVIKAADDADRAAKMAEIQTNGKTKKTQNKDEEDDDDEDSDDDSSGSSIEDMDEKSFRPNVAMMQTKSMDTPSTTQEKKTDDGVYRPPRISATVMPTTDRREKAERKPQRSKTLDEYVSTEYSAAPLAEPSIGSNIAAGGRSNKSARQLKDEAERRDYEEMNLVRLPKQSRKELARKGYGRERDGGFGGEDWRDLGSSLDRITDLTRRKGKDSALDKSRKRRAVEDGPRGDGAGSQFEIKKRRMQKRGQM